jgi:hypothetical protein
VQQLSARRICARAALVSGSTLRYITCMYIEALVSGQGAFEPAASEPYHDRRHRLIAATTACHYTQCRKGSRWL